MNPYTTRDVARILDLSPAKVRRYARASFVTPARGDRNELRFSFQDLALLRTARDLEAAEVPARRIHHALRSLRGQLSEGETLASLRLVADGHHVFVQEGATRWAPDSGQVQIDFAKIPSAGTNVAAEPSADIGARDADEWYELACAVESGSPFEARALYGLAIEVDPTHADARVNLGRLLHEEGRFEDALEQYRAALDAVPDHATAAFNLGVVLEDLGQSSEARRAYHRAVEADPMLADAFYNLSRIYEEAGDRAAALRYLQRYERLTRSRGPRRG